MHQPHRREHDLRQTLALLRCRTFSTGRAIDESANNLALAVGVGVPIAKRFGLEPTARDHVVSFKGVRDPEELGVEGRRAHTFVVSVSGRLGI